MSKIWLGREIADIIGVHMALEASGSPRRFKGFDADSTNVPTDPTEVEHLANYSEWADLLGAPGAWPRKSAGRHLNNYRNLVRAWTTTGKPLQLSPLQCRELELSVGHR